MILPRVAAIPAPPATAVGIVHAGLSFRQYGQRPGQRGLLEGAAYSGPSSACIVVPSSVWRNCRNEMSSVSLHVPGIGHVCPLPVHTSAYTATTFVQTSTLLLATRELTRPRESLVLLSAIRWAALPQLWSFGLPSWSMGRFWGWGRGG